MTSDSLISEAKALIANHEELFASGDLDAVMKNFADDVALIALNAPVLEGKSALRDFYASLLETGKWSLRHDYSGAAASDDCVFLHGVARGTHTPSNGDEPFTFANNFLIVVRRVNGRLLAWRAAFMPGASE